MQNTRLSTSISLEYTVPAMHCQVILLSVLSMLLQGTVALSEYDESKLLTSSKVITSSKTISEVNNAGGIDVPSGNNQSSITIDGTLWCGMGNAAHTYNDLGVHKDADRCCRAHDQCPYAIGAWSTKYALANWKIYTLSHCDCDRVFQECLANVNTKVSDTVFDWFFRALNVKCFRFEPGQACEGGLSYSWTSLKWFCKSHWKKTGELQAFHGSINKNTAQL